MKIGTLGGKGFNLIVLAQGDFRVPYAFIVSEEAFRDYRQSWNYSFDELGFGKAQSEEIQRQFDIHDLKYELIAEIQNQLHDLIYNSPIPNPLLAVRSSGVVEDLDDVSFAGMNETCLNVKCDIVEVTKAVKKCWKSIYSDRSIQYRVSNGYPAYDTSIAVIVQVMIPSDVSGVAFSADPQTGSRAHISLDGVQGLGDALVNGMVNADHWLIRKPYGERDMFIEDAHIHYQSFKLVSNYPDPGMMRVNLTKEEGNAACFSSHQVVLLSICQV